MKAGMWEGRHEGKGDNHYIQPSGMESLESRGFRQEWGHNISQVSEPGSWSIPLNGNLVYNIADKLKAVHSCKYARKHCLTVDRLWQFGGIGGLQLTDKITVPFHNSEYLR